jgi:carboxyl-terminal processing protease
VAEGVWRIRIPRFDGGDVYAAFREAVASIDPGRTRGLILDLRDNPGGNAAYGEAIFAHFIAAPCPTYTLDYTPVFAPTKINGHHGRLRLYGEGPTLRPADGPRFDCPVVLLVSALTASAAEDFAGLFRSGGRGLLIGQATAGGTGNGHWVDLPGGGMLRVALNVSRAYSGRGLAPDVAVEPDATDLAAGRDAELERALALLGEAGPSGR